MCTAIAAKTAEGDFLLGRTMDFSYPLDPELFVAAPGYAWPSLTGTQMLQSRFRFMGIGQDISPVVFSDGVNERGLCRRHAVFSGYAAYDSPSQEEGILQVAAAELVGYLLGQCAIVAQAVSLLRSIRIVGAEDPVTRSVARSTGFWPMPAGTAWRKNDRWPAHYAQSPGRALQQPQFSLAHDQPAKLSAGRPCPVLRGELGPGSS